MKDERQMQKCYRNMLLFIGAMTVAILVLGAAATRTPLLRAYLAGPLDGNGQAMTNVGGITLSGGGTVNGIVTNGYAAGTGFNVFHGTSNSGALLIFNAVTNGDSSIGVTSNANTLSLRATNITEAKLLLADNTTADVSTSAHGLIPKMSSTSNTIPMNWGGSFAWRAISNLLAAGTNITFLTTNGVTTIHAAGGSGGSSAVPLTNSVWVSKNGSDSTGARGDPAKAYLTLGAAKTNAVSGDTIFVLPGLYAEYDLNKNGVNWHFFNGSIVSNTTDVAAIFDYSITAGSFNVTGDGEFLDGHGGTIIWLSDASSTSNFRFKRMWGDGAPVFTSAGTLTLSGDIIESDGDVGLQGVVRIGGAGALPTILRTKLRHNGTGATADSIKYTTGNTNLILVDCTLLAGSGGSAIDGSGTTKIYIEGTLAANAALNAVTLQNTANITTIPGVLAPINAPTNTAAFNIDATDFNLDTNYTNGTQRAHVSASLLLSANASDTAQVALYLDQDDDETFEQIGITVTAQGLVTNSVQLSGWIQPGGVFAFTNLSTGSATAAVNAGGSQWVKQ